jgi:hypothetical protein
MQWQPFYQFKTGLDQQQWGTLSTSEQREALRGSSKGKPKPEVVEDGGEEYLIARTFAFPVRLVSADELGKMPVFEMY